MRRLLAGWVICLSVVSFAADQSRYAANQILVRLAADVSPAEAEKMFQARGMGRAQLIVPTLNLYSVELNGRSDVRSAVASFGRAKNVVYAQPDHLVSLRAQPNDPDFVKQWGMKNATTEGADIKATAAWDLGVGGKDRDGNDIVVAIVDGGVDLKHKDLVDNIWTNTHEIAGNKIDDDNNGYVDDVNGWSAYSDSGVIPADRHGTHVAGIAGASGDNNTNVVGVNWRVKIMAVAAASGNSSVVAKGYGYVIAQKKLWLETKGAKGANVVVTNSSFGIDYADCTASTYKVWNDLYEELGKYGILSAAATANNNVDVDKEGDIPTGCPSPHLLSVTNTDKTDKKSSFAGYGTKTIALGAPGTDVFSTLPNNSAGNLTGTSMSTPHVAGAVAFLHSVASADFQLLNRENPAEAALLLKKLMLENVDKIESLKGITISEGRLNLAAAGLAISNYKTPMTETSVR